MKLIRTEYLSLKQRTSFWAWLWWYKDYPYGWLHSEDEADYKFCGSANRSVLRCRFGVFTEHVYIRGQESFFDGFCDFVGLILMAILMFEVMIFIISKCFELNFN